MNLVPLLKSQLKSDPVVELLEIWDCEVMYDFDRTHENLSDKYWASAKEAGVQLLFDEHQTLTCIFLYTSATEDFSAIDLSNTDVLEFESIEEASSFANQNGINQSTGQGDLFGQLRHWVRLEWDDHQIHYEFREGVLSLVTLTCA